MTLTASALALGFLHGLGADHLMAIAALAVGPKRAEGAGPVQVALRFALGHALLLLLGAGAVLLLGWQIPVLVERLGEQVGGVLLIALGAFTLWVTASRRLYAHAHDTGEPLQPHLHLHLGRRERHPEARRHSVAPGLLGAVFAVSGLRALTLLAPELGGGAAASLATLVYLVGVFAIGILLSMSLFGIVLSRVLGSPLVMRAVGRGASAITALASIGLGAYWLVS